MGQSVSAEHVLVRCGGELRKGTKPSPCGSSEF